MSYRAAAVLPLLTAEVEIALAQAMEQGVLAQRRIDEGNARAGDSATVQAGERARRRFVESNVRLVMSIVAKTKTPGHVDRQDVIQDGMVGLDQAVARFDWRKGHRFSTYAIWPIRQAIQRGMETTASTIRIPTHRTIELRQAIAERGPVRERLSPRLSAVAALEKSDSIDRVIASSMTVGDLIADQSAGPEETVAARHEQTALWQILDRLEPINAQIVILRFGLDGSEPETFSAIAQRLGVSPEAVRRRLTRSLDKLRPMAEPLRPPDSMSPATAAHDFTLAA